MSRTDAMSLISPKHAAFDDEHIEILADHIGSMEQVEKLRQLSVRDVGLLEHSKADVPEGFTYRMDEAPAYTGALFAAFQVDSPKPPG